MSGAHASANQLRKIHSLNVPPTPEFCAEHRTVPECRLAKENYHRGIAQICRIYAALTCTSRGSRVLRYFFIAHVIRIVQVITAVLHSLSTEIAICRLPYRVTVTVCRSGIERGNRRRIRELRSSAGLHFSRAARDRPSRPVLGG